ncbi:hypothetical protein [Kosakonia sacchari]|uniref:hypothetical protein n=1 Tax=Kosakonia sacchari TaxID=1158459 RepID=UPI003F56865F
MDTFFSDDRGSRLMLYPDYFLSRKINNDPLQVEAQIVTVFPERRTIWPRSIL